MRHLNLITFSHPLFYTSAKFYRFGLACCASANGEAEPSELRPHGTVSIVVEHFHLDCMHILIPHSRLTVRIIAYELESVPKILGISFP